MEIIEKETSFDIYYNDEWVNITKENIKLFLGIENITNEDVEKYVRKYY